MPATIVTMASLSSGGGSGCTEEGPDSESVNVSLRLNNSATLLNLKQKLQHLSDTESAQLEQLIVEFLELFPDVPSRTTVMYHDVDVGNAEPVKQHPYRVNLHKRAYLQQEVKYMLENDLIECSQSPWNSLCVLVPKPDKIY